VKNNDRKQIIFEKDNQIIQAAPLPGLKIGNASIIVLSKENEHRVRCT
jgi:hypothetical protein